MVDAAVDQVVMKTPQMPQWSAAHGLELHPKKALNKGLPCQAIASLALLVKQMHVCLKCLEVHFCKSVCLRLQQVQHTLQERCELTCMQLLQPLHLIGLPPHCIGCGSAVL